MSGRNLRVNLIANTSRFKSAMSESSEQIKLLNSEFRNAAAETDQYGNKLDSTGAKKKQLNGVIEQYRRRVQAIKEEQAHWTRELEKGNITEEQHAQKQQELARRLNNTESEMKRYEGQLKRLNAEGQATTRTYADFDRQFRDVGRTMRDVSVKAGVVAGAGFLVMKRALSDVTDEAMTFHAQMSEVEAISGATGEEMQRLTDQSKELGRQTVFTSQQAAEAQANLARAGFEVNEIYDAMPGLLDLAASSNLDLGTSASITSNIIRSYNLEAEESARVADLLAKGAATADTDVQGLGQSFETAAPVAHSLGIQMESLAGATGTMADNGIDGSRAGRMLRQGMLRLSKPTGEAADILEDMNIELWDADGNMKQLDGVVAELEKGMKGYSKQQRTAALATIFGSESTAGWTILLEEGSDALAEYTDELKDSEGAAKEMADVMQDNAQGAVIRMQSALSALKIELGERLLPTLADGADFVADLATSFSEMDDATIETIAQTALLVTAVLGVTTAIAGVTAAVGAFMAFAGPVGLAITAGTALLGGLAGALAISSKRTKDLKEEQEEAKQEAIRYGDNLSEGTKRGVKGYVDLYEGAKLNMHKLKTMSGEEAEETKKLVVKAFKEMGDEVVSELEKFAGEFEEVIHEIYGVYGEAGEKRAKEINEQVQKDVEEMVTNYESASERIAEIIDEYGGNIEKYPEEVRKAYESNLKIMRDGAEVFATTYEDALAVRNRIAENKDKILFEEAQKYTKEIEQTHREAHENINQTYTEQADVIEQFKKLYPEHADIYDEMMNTLQTSTAEAYLEVDKAREESLKELYKNVDETGKLIDFQSGKEFERQEVIEQVNSGYDTVMLKREETDEEYYQRYVETTEDYLNAMESTSEATLDRIEKNAYEWRISMGDSEEDAKKFAKNIREGVLEELSKGDGDAEKSGKNKGTSFTTGLYRTKGDLDRTAIELNESTLDELSKGDSDAERYGQDKGNAHRYGLTHTWDSNSTAGRILSEGVTKELSKTSDGGGGRKAGTDFTAGVRSQNKSASSTAASLARRGELGLRSVSTSSAGVDFVSGFRNSISTNTGSIWNTAWSLGQRALSALRSSIGSQSPAKETAEEGINFIDGFVLSIKKGRKEAVQSAQELGKDSTQALSGELEHFKESFGELAFAIDSNKQSLKIEHEINNTSLEEKIKTLEGTLKDLINVISKKEEEFNNQPVIMNISVRDQSDVDKIDHMLNNLGNRRKAAWGGNN